MYVTSSSAHSNLWGDITHILQRIKFSERDNTTCLNHRYLRSYAKIELDSVNLTEFTFYNVGSKKLPVCFTSPFVFTRPFSQVILLWRIYEILC